MTFDARTAEIGGVQWNLQRAIDAVERAIQFIKEGHCGASHTLDLVYCGLRDAKGSLEHIIAPEPEAKVQTDHQGRPIPADESPDTTVLVWEVDPHPGTNNFDMLWERSWQEMLEYVTTNLPNFLERFDEEELRDGVTLKFRLIPKTLRHLEEEIDE